MILPSCSLKKYVSRGVGNASYISSHDFNSVCFCLGKGFFFSFRKSNDQLRKSKRRHVRKNLQSNGSATVDRISIAFSFDLEFVFERFVPGLFDFVQESSTLYHTMVHAWAPGRRGRAPHTSHSHSTRAPAPPPPTDTRDK